MATFIPTEASEKMGKKVIEKTLKIIGKRVDSDGDGTITKDELHKFLRGKLWDNEEVAHQLHDHLQKTPTGRHPLDEMRDYLADAMHAFHDTDGDGVVSVAEASRVTAEWLAVAENAKPVRRFIEDWKEFEESDEMECQYPDQIPTWAHSPDSVPVAPEHTAPCQKATSVYRELLADRGLLQGGRDEL